MSNSESSGRGSSSFEMFINMLQVLFIGLKLTGHIDWSWWWVMSPLWIQALLVNVLIIVLIIGNVMSRRK